MWYGLKADEELVAVKYFSQREPEPDDFGVALNSDTAYSVVVVRIREIGTMMIH